MATTTTIRVSRKTRDILSELAQHSGASMQQIADDAVAAYRGQQLLVAANEAYAALKKDPQAAQLLADERAEWDVTLADGLEDD
jgi:hypothetical protein